MHIYRTCRQSFIMMVLIVVCIWFVSPPTVLAESSPPELADPNGQFITINNLEIYYIESGPFNGPAVVFLHGFGGSTFTWRDNLDTLAEHGFRTIAFDRPPFGLSDKQPSADDLTDRAYADLTATLMDELGISSAIMVGHSAGGSVIAHFAMQYPERIDALVFVAGAIEFDEDTGQQASNTSSGSNEQQSTGIGSLLEYIGTIDPASPLARQLIRLFLTPERFVALLASAYHPSFEITEDLTHGYSRVLQIENWDVGFLTLLKREAISSVIDINALATLNIPVMIVWGEDDTWVPLDHGERLHEVIPSALWTTYPNVGHMPMEENIEQFNADLLYFVTAVYES